MEELPFVQLNERHFDLGNGRKRVQIYGQPIYYHEAGKLKHVKDYKLTDGTEVTNKADLFNVKVKGNKISYKLDGKTTHTEILGLYLDDTLLHELTDRVVGDNYIQWKLGDKVDYRLTITPYTVREEIIFKSNPLLGLPIDGENVYVKYRTQGNIKSKKAWAIDSKNKALPFIADDTKKGIPTKALYTYAYPITLDPTISPNPTSDAYLSDTTGVLSRIDSTIIGAYYASYSDSTGTSYTDMRAYMLFSLASLSGKTINTATCNLYKSSATGSPMTAVLQRATAHLDPEASALADVWNACNGGASLGTLSAPISTWKSIDVKAYIETRLGLNCGFVIHHGGSASVSYFNSSENTTNKPYLQVDYSDSGATTYTKTADAKARIKQANITKTVTSKARIKQPNNDKTVTARAKIAVIDTRTVTIDAKSRIKITTDQTTSSKASIIATATNYTKTIDASARIKQLDNSKTATAKARIKGTTAETATAKAQIRQTATQTTTAKARIRLLNTAVIDAKARIKANQTQTVTAKARIAGDGTVQSVGALARIKKLGTTTAVSALARIKQVSTTNTATARARIKHASITATLNAKARIKAVVARTVSPQARIKSTDEQTILAQSRIKQQSQATVTARASIKHIQQTTADTRARIKSTVATVISALARIKTTAINTIGAKAKLRAYGSIDRKTEFESEHIFVIDDETQIVYDLSTEIIELPKYHDISIVEPIEDITVDLDAGNA